MRKYTQKTLLQHISWSNLLLYLARTNAYKKRENVLNDLVTEKIRSDLGLLNIKMSAVSWREYFKDESYDGFEFESRPTTKPLRRIEDVTTEIEKLNFLDAK
jgi:hypothetical protein